jgi:hypothetical protein
MSSLRHGEPSPLWSRGDLIDQLIYQALLDEVREAEPSPQVWQKIYRSITATDAACPRRVSARRILSLLNCTLTALNGVLYDGDWEKRLMEYQRPVLWALPFSSSLAVAV